VALAGLLRLGGIFALAVWVAGVSGAFGPALNWTALVIGAGLVALSGFAGAD
jgi:hypothetical protein